MGLLRGLTGGNSPATVIACPQFPDLSPGTLDALDNAAQGNPDVQQDVIELSKLGDKLDRCNRK